MSFITSFNAFNHPNMIRCNNLFVKGYVTILAPNYYCILCKIEINTIILATFATLILHITSIIASIISSFVLVKNVQMRYSLIFRIDCLFRNILKFIDCHMVRWLDVDIFTLIHLSSTSHYFCN